MSRKVFKFKGGKKIFELKYLRCKANYGSLKNTKNEV